MKEANYDSLFCSVQITDTVEVRSIYKASNSEITLYLKDADFSIYISFMYTGTDDSYWTEEENFVGKNLKLQAFIHSIKAQILERFHGKSIQAIQANWSV